MEHVFGISAEKLKERGNCVEVGFTNGDTDRFDILVGADGQGSRTRKMMRGSEVDTSHPLDEYTAYFTIPRDMEEGEEYIATSYIAPGSRFVLTRRHDPHRIQVYLTGKSVTGRLKSAQRGDANEEKKVFAEVFRGAGWQVDSILESLMEADDFYCEFQGLVKLNSWYQSRVVLLGDAAYCPSASTGMGAFSAIVGSYILAGEIGRHPRSHTTAFRAYDTTFRPFMKQVQKGVGDSGIFDKIPWSPFTIGVLYRLMWLALCLRLDLLGRGLGDGPVKEWKLPEYEILGNLVSSCSVPNKSSKSPE